MDTYQSGAASASAPAPIGAKLIEFPPSSDADLPFAEIIDTADLVASYCRSLAESALRRDVIQLRIDRAQFRQAVIDLLALIRDVAPIEGGRA
jgi:hypothetical protein